ncbi:uncharacterized protein LOC126696915 [Quercus robur]|uniref:uncharacterized protein LOC126696915 n=1 Tax=Quercus robur TaxID=38942 RepID=UPI002163F72D|nr:uncharacterized protein LOC126696915 [Quercus robur]
MQLFRDVVDECGFLDLGFVGPQFTWSKHYAAGHSVWERLDRGLANYEWLTKFVGARVYHLHSDSSDHCPLLITLTDLKVACKKKIFRFEEMWLFDKGCSDTVEAVWLTNEFDHSNNQILGKIEKCGVELTKWSREKFGNVRNELEKKRRQLAEAEKVAMELGLNTRVRELKSEIEILLDREN